MLEVGVGTGINASLYPSGCSVAGIDLSASITGVHSAIAIGTAPAHGTVTIAGDVVTYTPAATYYGTDSFTFTVSDGSLTSAAATVSLTVTAELNEAMESKLRVIATVFGLGLLLPLGAAIALPVATLPAPVIVGFLSFGLISFNSVYILHFSSLVRKE